MWFPKDCNVAIDVIQILDSVSFVLELFIIAICIYWGIDAAENNLFKIWSSPIGEFLSYRRLQPDVVFLKRIARSGVRVDNDILRCCWCCRSPYANHHMVRCIFFTILVFLVVYNTSGKLYYL